MSRETPEIYGGQGPRQQWRKRQEEETRTAPKTHTRTGQAHMRSDMRMSINVRVELRVAGVPVGGHLLAGLQGIQRSHRNSAYHVPDDQLVGVQQLRMGVMR